MGGTERSLSFTGGARTQGAAGRLYDRLERTFGPRRLFMDVDNIPPGQDFVAVLDAQVAACDVFLALIGRGWLTATDKNGNRRLVVKIIQKSPAGIRLECREPRAERGKQGSICLIPSTR